MAASETHGTFEQIIDGCDPPIAAIASALKARITAMHRDHVEIVWPRMKADRSGSCQRGTVRGFPFGGTGEIEANPGELEALLG